MRINKGNKCSVQSCAKPAFCKGYCTLHYQQIKFTGMIKERSTLTIGGFCKNLGCGKLAVVKGMCQNCYVKSRLEKVKNAG